MRNVSRIVSCMLLVVIGHVALAQTRPVSQALDFWITNTEKEVVSAADAMPEGKYSFAPTAGEFTGVRTFAEPGEALISSQLPVGCTHSG
jgi:hypothetical protein